ncbi:MAG: hypothetical protein ABI639_05405 [Thermoanaerobaculia bacterium]
MRIRPLILSALLFAPSIALPRPASASGPTVRVDVDSDKGKDVHLRLEGGLLGHFLRAMAPVDIDCDGSDDPKVRQLYLSLEHGGDGSRGTVWDERKRIDARRSGEFLVLAVGEEDGDKVDIKMPWSLARCVLGGEDLSRKEISSAMETGEFSIHVQDEDSNVHISFD